MYNLLIVDDEIATVEGLSANPWGELGISNIYKANSAFEAFEIIENNSVDIVITDIRMPGKSGIELIKQINDYDASTKSILLSGYSDFEYAKQAIQQNAFDYLLKPVSDEDLMTTVDQALQVIKQEREQITSYQQALDTIERNRPLLRSDFLNELLKGNIKLDKQLEDKLKVLELPLKVGDPVLLLLLKNENSSLKDKQSETVLTTSKDVLSMIHEVYSTVFHFVETIEDNSHFVILLYEKERRDPNNTGLDLKFQQQVEELAQQLRGNITRLFKRNLSIIVSKVGVFPNSVPLIYQECLRSFHSDEVDTKPEDKNRSIIQQIQEYVHQQLDTASSISLQDVADQVYMHPAYLSKFYKLKTGEGFSEYVHRTKMEKAAYLLGHTTEKIHRISAMLGYQDPSYFIRVFKKYFNVTPHEYRR